MTTCHGELVEPRARRRLDVVQGDEGGGPEGRGMKRGAFIASSATVVAASGASGLAQSSPPGGTHFVERKSDFDRPAFEAIVGRSADVRQLFETIAFKPAAFNNVKNSLNGFQFGYGYDPRSIAIAVAGHGPSSAFTYTDYVWKKYRIGEFLAIKDPRRNADDNVYYAAKAPYDVNADPDDEKGMYQDTSVETLQRRGVIMLTCHTAVEEQAKGSSKAVSHRRHAGIGSGLRYSDASDSRRRR